MGLLSPWSDPNQPTMDGSSSIFYGGTTLPTEPTLPDWMNTDPNTLNQELMDQYNNVGMMGANRAARKIDKQKALTLSSGTQSANNAGLDYASRIMQQGGSAAAAGAVKAQAMMPVLKQVADIEVGKQAMLMDARKTMAMRRDALASQLAQSRQSYLNTLAGTYTTMRGQNTQFEMSGRSTGAGSTGSRPAGSGGAGGGLIPPWMGGAGSFFPGYIPNQGPLIPGSGYPMANGHNVLTGYRT